MHTYINYQRICYMYSYCILVHSTWRTGIKLKFSHHHFENTVITKMQLTLFKFKYFTSRFLDIIFTMLITDSLISIFANRNLFLFPIRKISFLLLNNFLFIRKLILNQMTKSIIYSRIK